MQGKHFDLTEDEQEARSELERELILRYDNEEGWTEEGLTREMVTAGIIEEGDQVVSLGYAGREFSDVVRGDVLVLYGPSQGGIHLFDAATGEYLAEPQGAHKALYRWAEEELARKEGAEGDRPMTRSEWASYRADRELHRRREDWGADREAA